MTAAAAAAPSVVTPGLSLGRRALVWTLVVVASVVMFLSVMTLWVDRQMLDDHAWRQASAELIADPQIRQTLSVYLADQLYANADVAGALRTRLPDQLKPLAGPAAQALLSQSANVAALMLARPRIQQLFVEASARAHDRLVAVLENKTRAGITTGNGVVSIDLDTLVRDLGAQLGLPEQALARIPDTSGIVVMRSTQLATAQSAVRLVHALSAWLLVLVLGMYGLAVVLAGGLRRVVLRREAWAFILVGLLVLVVRKLTGNYAVDALTSPSYRPAGRAVWLIESSILGQIGWACVLYGVVALAGVLLAGPTRIARTIRRAIAPVLNERPVVTWTAWGTVVLLLALWGGTHALRTWWGIALVAGLLAAGLAALRRETLAEARAGGEPLTWSTLGNGASADTAPFPTTAAEHRSAAEELVQLDELHRKGSITDDEYVRGKERTLA